MARVRHPIPLITTPFVAPRGPLGRATQGRAVLAIGLLVSLALTGAGCSISFPIAGFTGDNAPTGTIRKPQALLSPALDAEDWRRAKAALAVALDPQGNGARVAWDNPQTGANGSFVALASPFVEEDRVCRTFDARVVPGKDARRHLVGSACRVGEAEWSLRDVKEQGAS